MRSSFICSTPRAGSTMLAELLKQTGVAGRPEEWFWPIDAALGPKRVLRAGTTANGVFGSKLAWGHLPGFEPHEASFPSPAYAFLRRDDTVAQAVSHARAIQTGRWHSWDAPADVAPAYDCAAIDSLAREVREQNAAWRRWFDERGAEPLEVVYEDLATAPGHAVRAVLGFLGLDLPPGVDLTPPTERLADATSAAWAERYRRGRCGPD